MDTSSTLILGGGFGGLATANRLRQLFPDEHEITVVDKTSHFHIGAGKTWIMLGEKSYEEISQSRNKLLLPGVRFLQANITSINVSSRTVNTDKELLHWDYLVIALGAELNLSSVPGLAENASTFYTVDGAKDLQVKLSEFTSGKILILIPSIPFKCPPAPYEAAMLLHSWFEKRSLRDKVNPSIYTIEPAPMATAGPEIGQFIKNELSQRRIEYYPQKRTKKVDGTNKRVVFEDGSGVQYDLLIAIPPHEAPKVILDANLVDVSGWIQVDPKTMGVTSISENDRVYAIGDVTKVPLPGRYKPDAPLVLPKAGVFAESQGIVVAQQIAAKFLGKEPEEVFDGMGYCYFELGGGQAMKAEGNFFALPHPVMERHLPDEAHLREKFEWVKEHLRGVE